MQKQEKKFSTGHRSSFWIKLSFGIGHPPPICQMQCICVGEGSRVPNLQTEFNYLDSFKSYGIFSGFVVPMWSPSSSCRQIVPVIPTSSPSSSRHPHSPQKVPMWSPWSVVSVVSTCCPRRPRVVPPSSPRRPCHPHIIQKVPRSFPTPQIATTPTPTSSGGVGGPECLKMQ